MVIVVLTGDCSLCLLAWCRNVSLSRAVEEDNTDSAPVAATPDVAVPTFGSSPATPVAAARGLSGGAKKNAQRGKGGNIYSNSENENVETEEAPVELMGPNVMNNEVLFNSHTKAGYLYQLLKTGVDATGVNSTVSSCR
jgi:hypothetical protein